MIINTQESCGGGWVNGSISFGTVEDLKKQLKNKGKETVCLYEWQGANDDLPYCVTGNIKVDSLHDIIVNWLVKSSNRYLGI